MDTSQWPTILLLVALLPSRTLCQTEPTTSLTTRDGIDSVGPSPLPNAHGEPAAGTTFKPSDDSFSSTTTRTPLEDFDKFNELYSAVSEKKSSSKSNKPLSERTKATKFQGDTTTVSPPPAPVFTATEVPGSPERLLTGDQPGSHAEEKPVATYPETLAGEPASSPPGQVPDSLTDPAAPPASPAGDFGNQPVYVPTHDGAAYPFEGTGAVGLSPPTGNSEAQYAGPPGELPNDNLPGTFPPQLTNGGWAPHFELQADPSRSPTLQVGQGFGHGGEVTPVPSNAREVSSQSEPTFPISDGVNPTTGDTQGSFESPVASDEPQSHQYYSGPSSFGYGREALPETTTVLPPSNADLLGFGPSADGVAPSVSDVSGSVSEPVNSALTTPQPELLGVSNSVQSVPPEEKSAAENGGTTTPSPDPVAPSEIAALALNDSKTGRSMNLDGDSMTDLTTPAGISDQEKHASPIATTSPSSIDVTTSASETSGAQEIAQGTTGDVYVSQDLPTSTPKVEETTQHLEITTALSTDGKVDQEDSLTLYPDRYHPTSTVNATTTAPNQMTPSSESSTSVPSPTTQSGVAGTTEHEEMTAAGVTEGMSAVGVTGTTSSPTNSFVTSTADVPEISTDLPSSSPTASSTTSPPTQTPLTDAPTTVEPVTTHHIVAEPDTSLPPTSTVSTMASTTAQPESPQPTTTLPINQGSIVVDATTDESNTKSPTTAEPTTTIDSFMAGSKNTETTTSEPAAAVPVTAQPTSPEISTTQPTTAAPTTLVPVTTEPIKDNPTTMESTTARIVILDLTTVDGASEAPMTQAQTTAVPATEAPTTTVPTNAVQTTEVSATEVPTTQVPTTEVPTTDIPTTDVPTTDVSMTEAPATVVPTTEAPTTAVPTTTAPTTEAPTTTAATTAAPTTSESTTVESTTPEVTTLPSVMSVSIFESAGTSTTEAHTTPETTTTEATTTPEATSVATSGILVGRGPSGEQEQPTTRAATTPEPQVGEMTTAGALDPWTTLVHSASRNPKQLTHPTTSSPEQAASSLPTDSTTAVVSDAAFTTVTPLDTFTSSESGEQETTTRRDLFTTLFPEITTMMKASTTTEAAPTTAQVVVVSDNSIETETVATVTADVSCDIEKRNLTVACLLPQELNNTVTVKFSEWDHGRTEAFRIEAKRRLADYCFRKGIPLGDTTVVFVANEHGMDLISFFVINQARGSVVPAATLIAFLNETKPTLEDAVNLTINDVSLGLPSVEQKTASTGVASILGGPFKALYVIIAASVAALLILIVIIVLMIKCRSLSSNQYSPDVEKLTKDLHMRSDIGDLRPGDEILKEEAQLKDASAFVINGNGTHLTRDGDGWVVPYSQVPTEAKNGVPDAQDTRL